MISQRNLGLLYKIQVSRGGEDSQCDLLGFDVIDDGKSESK
jgi:hypothetical protein